MKWRHSKEAQAQKDKEKEQPDKSATETEQKERDDSECESEPSESEFEDGAEDKSDVDISDLSKASVIIPSTQDTSSTNSTTEPSSATQLLLWVNGTESSDVNTSNTRVKRLTGQRHKIEHKTHTNRPTWAIVSCLPMWNRPFLIPEKGKHRSALTEPLALLYDDLGIECSWIKTWLYYISSVSICTENVNKRLLLIFQVVYLWKSSSKIQ